MGAPPLHLAALPLPGPARVGEGVKHHLLPSFGNPCIPESTRNIPARVRGGAHSVMKTLEVGSAPGLQERGTDPSEHQSPRWKMGALPHAPIFLTGWLGGPGPIMRLTVDLK